jgi:hypothetical protein
VLPGVQERFNQRLERIGAWLEREKAPLAAAAECRRPLPGVMRTLWPCLSLERRQHARLRERGFADTRIAEQHRKPVRRRRERVEYLDGFPRPAKK